MTVSALLTLLLIMTIVLTMTAIAVGTYFFIIRIVKMAGLTLDFLVRADQRKLSFLVVIET